MSEQRNNVVPLDHVLTYSCYVGIDNFEQAANEMNEAYRAGYHWFHALNLAKAGWRWDGADFVPGNPSTARRVEAARFATAHSERALEPAEHEPGAIERAAAKAVRGVAYALARAGGWKATEKGG